ncbi:hypothetical protein GCM10022243_04440 [Saccharothrix violaceirubra]|uniref:Uncharacterized protein n=1 Tax=Saccharothrix violaceirubra TaxID=413306 RepID=A0A7W7WTU7_9PSEU|nr:hypothetical protein [Saccharothrix violaceirubra]MBB4962853.1 hypothetical protein [Saccharothrix violaceirubra]
MTTTPDRKFEVTVGKSEAALLGPSWETGFARRTVQRIDEQATTDEAIAQGIAEGVMVLHSIRRILIWTAVIVPTLITGAVIVLMAVGGESSCTSVYTC